jgi:HD-like signal output (HDOD) protein
MNAETVLKKLDHIEDIPTLPTIVLELNTLLQNPNTPITEITDVIEKDQSMSLKILKLVNSAFYGVQSKVADIGNAIILLGFNTVRNAILSLSVKSGPKNPQRVSGQLFCGRTFTRYRQGHNGPVFPGII